MAIALLAAALLGGCAGMAGTATDVLDSGERSEGASSLAPKPLLDCAMLNFTSILGSHFVTADPRAPDGEIGEELRNSRAVVGILRASPRQDGSTFALTMLPGPFKEQFVQRIFRGCGAQLTRTIVKPSMF